MMSSFHYCLLLSLFLLFVLESSAKRCHPDDERALLKIKSHFNNVTFFSSWTPQTPCCRKWNLVSCTKLNNSVNNIYRVNFLEINGEEGIKGEIPDAVGDLPYLDTLILRNNPNLTGPIPAAIGKLTRLSWLSLNWNNLTGPVPTFLTRLTNLNLLDLNDNRLTGPIPSYIGRLPSISDIWLSNNQLTGRIPDTFGLLPNKSFLRLSNNKLSGPIPTSLGRVNFENLELAGNQLTGDASFLFGEDKSELDTLDLSSNMLSFNLSNTVFTTDPSRSQILLSMDLSHNMIYGGIPSWLGPNTTVYYLNLSYNRLCGPVPTRGVRLPVNYDASIFSNNTCLCGGPLPACD